VTPVTAGSCSETDCCGYRKLKLRPGYHRANPGERCRLGMDQSLTLNGLSWPGITQSAMSVIMIMLWRLTLLS